MEVATGTEKSYQINTRTGSKTISTLKLLYHTSGKHALCYVDNQANIIKATVTRVTQSASTSVELREF